MSTNNGFCIFRFSSEANCFRVLDLGPWFFAGKLLILQKWHEGLQLSKVKLSRIPVWVKFYNVPLNLWTNEGFSYVASAVGVPLYLDDATESRSRINYARVCVEISAENEIPENFDLDLGKGRIISIDVEVPWRPPSCKVCKEFGHTINNCHKVLRKVWVPKDTGNTQDGSPVIPQSEDNCAASSVILTSPQNIEDLSSQHKMKDNCVNEDNSELVPIVNKQSSEWTVVARKGRNKVIMSPRMQKDTFNKVPLDVSKKGIFVMPSSLNPTSAPSKVQNERSKFMESALASLKLKPSKSCIKDSNSKLPIRSTKITINSPSPTGG